MPWIQILVSASAWDMVFGNIGEYIDSPIRFIAGIIPLSAAIIVYSAAFNKENYPISKQLLFVLPLITLVVIFFIIINKIGATNFRFSDIKFDEFIKIFGIGFWLTLFSSFVLLIMGFSSSPISQQVAVPATAPIAPQADAAIPVNINEPTPIETEHTEANSNTHNIPDNSSTLLLIASGLIFVGFFMPWVEVHSTINSLLPTINGTYLLSQANQLEHYHLLFVCILLLPVICPAIIAYDAYQKTLKEKRTTIFIALATFLPVAAANLYFFAQHATREIENLTGQGAGLGTGLIMMLIGSGYYLVYVFGKITKGSRELDTRSILRYGIMGGIVPAILYFLLMKIRSFTYSHFGEIVLVAAPWLFPLFTIITTNLLHRKSLGGRINYSRIVTLGCICTIVFGCTCYLLISLFFPYRISEIPFWGNLFIPMIIYTTQIGLILSSIIGVWIVDNSNYIAGSNSAVKAERYKTLLSSIAAFAKKRKKIIIPSLALLTVATVLWFILKPNPVKEGRKAAMITCDCINKRTDQIVKAYEDYLKVFSSQNFKRRSEAKNKLSDLLKPEQAADIICRHDADKQAYELQNQFNADPTAIQKFRDTLNYILSIYHPKNESREIVLLTQINQKITSITDPEPDINTIKLDLIGKSIPGWTFNAASDIKDVQILSSNRLPNRIEYTAHFKLQSPNDSGQPHDAEILIIYTYDGNQWSQVNDIESYITYTYVIPTGNYINVCPLDNCNWTAPNVGNLSWKVGGDYGTEYISGPGKPQLNLPNSGCFLLRSLDNAPIDLTFTFKPK